MPLVSVVVPTRNESANIVRCLSSIRAQTYPDIEVILVDNFSTDATLALADGLADHAISAGPERCSQRNIGAKAARGAYVLFIDADMQLTAGVVQACVDASTGPHSVAVVIPEASVGSTFWARCKQFEKRAYAGNASIEAPRFFRREDFLAVGGYDGNLRAFEDWDLRARIEGRAECVRIRDLIIHHEGAITPQSSFAKKRYYAASFAEYARKHPDEAKEQVSLARLGVLARGALSAPHLFLGTIILKACEYVGFRAGLAPARDAASNLRHARI